MGYVKKEHHHARQVKVLLNDEEFIRFKEFANDHGMQHSAFGRIIFKALIEVIEETGEVPEWIEKKMA